MYFRYCQVKKLCPRCEYQWSDDISSTMFNLRKVSVLRMRQPEFSYYQLLEN
jgi:hypothetical protein